MTTFQFLQKYVELQKDIMFDELYDLGFALICFSGEDSSAFWNNALVNSDLDMHQVQQIESKLKELGRKPALYFENKDELQPLTDLLFTIGYSQEAEDSLMTHNALDIETTRFENVKKVENEQDLEEFIKTFDKCYRADDPNNPYGELGEYLVAARSAWQKHHKNNRIEYFTAFDGTTPVAVASLTNYGGIGYISNVGSLVDVRGKGFGKLATMYCVQQSKNNGNTTHCLFTEEGTNPNAFYKSLGFETKFTAKLMSKS